MDKTVFDLYTDYLLCSFGSVTATGSSQLVDGAVSHDQITRLLASEEKRSAHLWQKVKSLVRQVQAPEGVLIIDDSVAAKPYTDENELICWHWDHAKGRNVKGINFVSAVYHVPGVTLPVAFDLVTKTETYYDPTAKKEKRRSPLSKNARFRTLVPACVHNQIPFAYVLADLWFASADNLKFVVQVAKKHFVMPLKSNRKVALSQDDQRHARYTTVEKLALTPGDTGQIWVEDVPFALLLTKEVFTNKDGSTGERYAVTDDLTRECRADDQALSKTMGGRSVSRSLKTKCLVRAVPHTHPDHATQSLVCESVCLHQTRKCQTQNRRESIRLEIKTLCGGTQDRLSGTCQPRTRFSRCVT